MRPQGGLPERRERRLFWDQSCDGGQTPGRWILDRDRQTAMDTTALSRGPGGRRRHALAGFVSNVASLVAPAFGVG